MAAKNKQRDKEKYENVDYFPVDSIVHNDWLNQSHRRKWKCDKWLVTGLIGFTVGIIGFLLTQLICLVATIKWQYAQHYITTAGLLTSWAWAVGYSLIFVIFGSSFVVLFCLAAMSGGVPDVIAFLNGVVIRGTLNLTVLASKFFSAFCANAAGLPLGIEGPMITTGAIVGKRLIAFLPYHFNHLRNNVDRHNFVLCGAAAGVAAAFGAPVGGLLFCMEEVASFWTIEVGCQVLLCTLVATFVVDVLESCSLMFARSGLFGVFIRHVYIPFEASVTQPMSLFIFLLAVLLGFIGGCLGPVFISINVYVNRLREQFYVQRHPRVTKLIIWTTIAVILPGAFSCLTTDCIKTISAAQRMSPSNYRNDVTNKLCDTSHSLTQYSCPSLIAVNDTIIGSGYNDEASLLQRPVAEATRLMFSRQSADLLTYEAVSTTLVLFFLFAAWSSGLTIGGGVIMPIIHMGSLYGRLLGMASHDLRRTYSSSDPYWGVIDPGAVALIGAASALTGVCRLILAAAVVTIEMSGDVDLTMPVIAAVLVAKWVADQLSPPLYHRLLELKRVPVLHARPESIKYPTERLQLKNLTVGDIIRAEGKTVVTIETVEHMDRLAKIVSSSYTGFPVVSPHAQHQPATLRAFITRKDIMALLLSVRNVQTSDTTVIEPHLTYDDLLDFKCSSGDVANIRQRLKTPGLKEFKVNLERYVNRSVIQVSMNFSLHRAYLLFRTLGLRHIVVTGPNNDVTGVLTRLQLMPASLAVTTESLDSSSHHVTCDVSCHDNMNDDSAAANIVTHSTSSVALALPTAVAAAQREVKQQSITLTHV